MKILSLCCVAAVTFATFAYSQAPRDGRQDGRPEPPPPRGDRPDDRPGPPPPRGDRPGAPPRDPFLQLFDTDGNDEISTKEIEAAVAILKKLDRDGNGVLTRHELPRPPRPGDEQRGGADRDDRPAPRGDDRNREQNAEKRANAPAGTVFFDGGYETERVDRGRPVSLIAAALGVKSEVFRQAFSGVTPARGGDPSAAQARANKKVLIDALGKHGISNERLDAVSNYYRYTGAAGEVWRRTPATAKAIIRNGDVIGFIITNPGAGYTTAPTITVAGYGNVRARATIEFTKDFKTNGRVRTLTIVTGGSGSEPTRR